MREACKEACNVVLVEDDPVHRHTITRALESDGHAVHAFKDIATLSAARKKDLVGFARDRRLVVVLDAMLAFDLGEANGPARRWQRDTRPTEAEAKRYVDDTMGLQVAKEIRHGERSRIIQPDAPILFLTARGNKMICDEIKKIGRADYLAKPAFSRDVCKAIAKLTADTRESRRNGRNEH